jgi:hypothetical protein
MKYALNFSPKLDVSSPPVTGAIIATAIPPLFVAWQPSTWPTPPAAVDEKFVFTLKQIFEESILGEIENVMSDVRQVNRDLQHRGHVIAIALMCALTAISSYGYRGQHAAKFIRKHFRPDYHPHADQIYTLYRNSFMHSWNLFRASVYPDDSKIKLEGGAVAFGLLDFSQALVQATENFLETLESDAILQRNTLKRYKTLRDSAIP